jgi:uncharacterized protein YceH (UPF0502 family)
MTEQDKGHERKQWVRALNEDGETQIDKELADLKAQVVALESRIDKLVFHLQLTFRVWLRIKVDLEPKE